MGGIYVGIDCFGNAVYLRLSTQLFIAMGNVCAFCLAAIAVSASFISFILKYLWWRGLGICHGPN